MTKLKKACNYHSYKTGGATKKDLIILAKERKISKPYKLNKGQLLRALCTNKHRKCGKGIKKIENQKKQLEAKLRKNKILLLAQKKETNKFRNAMKKTTRESIAARNKVKELNRHIKTRLKTPTPKKSVRKTKKIEISPNELKRQTRIISKRLQNYFNKGIFKHLDSSKTEKYIMPIFRDLDEYEKETKVLNKKWIDKTKASLNRFENMKFFKDIVEKYDILI